MKFAILLIFIFFFNFSESERWKLEGYDQDFDNLNKNYFSQENYDNVTKLVIDYDSDDSPKRIEQAKFEFLKKFNNLELLFIENFKFDSFEEIKFGNKLKDLILFDNKIKNLHENQIKNLVNLEELHLGVNKIEILCENYLQNNRKLKEIRFDSNKIKKIPKNFLRGLAELEIVYFSQNEIKYLPSSLFEDTRKLKEVMLHENQVQKLDPELFIGLNLERIYFKNNPCAGDTDGWITNLDKCYEEWRQSGPPDDGK